MTNLPATSAPRPDTPVSVVVARLIAALQAVFVLPFAVWFGVVTADSIVHGGSDQVLPVAGVAVTLIALVLGTALVCSAIKLRRLPARVTLLVIEAGIALAGLVFHIRSDVSSDSHFASTLLVTGGVGAIALLTPAIRRWSA